MSDEQFLTSPFLPRFHLFSHKLKFFLRGPPGPLRTPGPGALAPATPPSRWAWPSAVGYAAFCCRSIALSNATARNRHTFLLGWRIMMLACWSICLSICPSVRPSHAGTDSKLMTAGSSSFDWFQWTASEFRNF